VALPEKSVVSFYLRHYPIGTGKGSCLTLGALLRLVFQGIVF